MVQSGRLQMGVTIDALNVRISKFSLYELATLAYQVKGYQISGPDWMATERYDIQAKLPEGGKRGQVPAMLQALLAERFGMRVHRENRELNAYALVTTKGGPHLKPSPAEDTEPAAPAGQLRGGLSMTAAGVATSSGPDGSWKVDPSPGGNLHVETRKMTMVGLVNFIGRYCDRPVIELTEIKGKYDMELDVSGEEMRNAARSHGVTVRTPEEGASDPAGVSLASSLQKLGLKLEARKLPTEVIVIDKVEKVPTAN
jgi:uncharacterized protein (TIGR03435 family)